MSDCSLKQEHNIDQMICEIREGLDITTSSINVDNKVIEDYSKQYTGNFKHLQEEIGNNKEDNAFYTIPVISEIEKFKNAHKNLKFCMIHNNNDMKLSEYKNNRDLNTLNENQKKEINNILHTKLFSSNLKIEPFKSLKLADPNPKEPSELYQTNITKFYEILQQKILKLVKFQKFFDKTANLFENLSYSKRLEDLGKTHYYESKFYKFLSADSQKKLNNELSGLKGSWNCDNKFDENVIYVIKKQIFDEIDQANYIQLLFMYYVIEHHCSDFICPYITSIFEDLKQKISNNLSYQNAIEIEKEDFGNLFNFAMVLVSHVHECPGIKKFISNLNVSLQNFLDANEKENYLLYFINSLREEQIFNQIHLTLVERFTHRVLADICSVFPPIGMLVTSPRSTNERIKKESKEIIKFGPLDSFLNRLMSNVNYKMKVEYQKEILSEVLSKLYRKIGEPYKPNLVLPKVFDPQQKQQVVKKKSKEIPRQSQQQSLPNSRQVKSEEIINVHLDSPKPKKEPESPKQNQPPLLVFNVSKSAETFKPKPNQNELESPKPKPNQNEPESPKPKPNQNEPESPKQTPLQYPDIDIVDPQNEPESPKPKPVESPKQKKGPTMLVFNVSKPTDSPKPKQVDSPKPQYPEVNVTNSQNEPASPKPKQPTVLVFNVSKPAESPKPKQSQQNSEISNSQNKPESPKPKPAESPKPKPVESPKPEQEKESPKPAKSSKLANRIGLLASVVQPIRPRPQPQPQREQTQETPGSDESEMVHRPMRATKRRPRTKKESSK